MYYKMYIIDSTYRVRSPVKSHYCRCKPISQTVDHVQSLIIYRLCPKTVTCTRLLSN